MLAVDCEAVPTLRPHIQCTGAATTRAMAVRGQLCMGGTYKDRNTFQKLYNTVIKGSNSISFNAESFRL